MMIQLFSGFRSWSLFVLLTIAFSSNAQNPSALQLDRLTYPFSQLVVRNDWAAPIVWKYGPFKDIIETETIIAPPKMTDDWNDWFRRMKAYQTYIRQHLNDTSYSYPERGGCASWTLQTSRWYFPGTVNSNSPGGEQPLDSHSKFFLMQTGFDRAGTIGFRCVK